MLQKWTVSAYLIRISDFRILNTTIADKVRFDSSNVNSLS